MRNWLKQPVHISWRIAVLSCGVIIGTALALCAPPSFSDTFWLGLAAVLLVLVCLRQRWWCLVAFLAGALFGLWHGTHELREFGAYRAYYGYVVQARGILRDDMSYGRHGEQRAILQQVQLDDGPILAGQLWVSLAGHTDIKRGDTVTVKGMLGEGFGVTPASMYRASVVFVERPHPGDMARVFRDWFAEAVRRGIPEPQASLGIGYLTGQRSSLPAELDGQLRAVGLTHAVVASGYNLTILVSFARNMLASVSKYAATLCAAAMVLGFMMVTGLSPSMTRAGLVSGLSLLTWYYGRSTHPVILLLFTAALTVGIHPAYAWGDIGWCLSFAAFAGVVIVAPLLRRYFWEAGQEPPFILGLLLETVAAQLTTLPIILFAFGQLAVYALPANLLVLPLVPFTMACTFLAGIIGCIAPQLATLGGWPASMLLQYMTRAVSYIAELPGAQKELHIGVAGLVSSYVVLAMVCLYIWRKTGLDFRNGPG